MSTASQRTQTDPASLSAEDIALDADAAALEQLRREIAEAGAKGIKPSRTKLAEFARLQRNYLDRKFAAERRKQAVLESSTPSAVHFAKLIATVPAAGKQPAAADPSSAAPAPPASKVGPPKPSGASKAADATPESEKIVYGRTEIVRADGSTSDSRSLRNTRREGTGLFGWILRLLFLGAIGYTVWHLWQNGWRF